MAPSSGWWNLVKRQWGTGWNHHLSYPIVRLKSQPWIPPTSSKCWGVLGCSRPPCVSFLREKGLGTTGATGGVALTCGHVTGFHVWIPVVGFGFRGSPRNGGIPGRYPNRLEVVCIFFWIGYSVPASLWVVLHIIHLFWYFFNCARNKNTTFQRVANPNPPQHRMFTSNHGGSTARFFAPATDRAALAAATARPILSWRSQRNRRMTTVSGQGFGQPDRLSWCCMADFFQNPHFNLISSWTLSNQETILECVNVHLCQFCSAWLQLLDGHSTMPRLRSQRWNEASVVAQWTCGELPILIERSSLIQFWPSICGAENHKPAPFCGLFLDSYLCIPTWVEM